jgi:Transposase DDE domain
VFLTNQTALPPSKICDLYKSRWQVQLFFKWIKQHLRIKQFYGIGERREDANPDRGFGLSAGGDHAQTAQPGGTSLHINAVFWVTVFKKTSIESVLPQIADNSDLDISGNQLNLFN